MQINMQLKSPGNPLQISGGPFSPFFFFFFFSSHLHFPPPQSVSPHLRQTTRFWFCSSLHQSPEIAFRQNTRKLQESSHCFSFFRSHGSVVLCCCPAWLYNEWKHLFNIFFPVLYFFTIYNYMQCGRKALEQWRKTSPHLDFSPHAASFLVLLTLPLISLPGSVISILFLGVCTITFLSAQNVS